ncbi:MAG: hypothetical protein ACREKH_00495, partial [Candidatus Rokuibacteriota bacterium]
NGKMSDVAAAFILERARHLETIRAAYLREFRRVAGIARTLGLELLVDVEPEGSLPNLVPILFPRPVEAGRLAGGPMVMHKYYRPVATTPRAERVYARVVCVPCHRDVERVGDGELRAMLNDLMG